MKRLLLVLGIFSSLAFGQQYQFPVPKDPLNTPIYGGLGLPVIGNSVQLDDATWEDVLTVPLTGVNTGRQYRAICVYNPSSGADVKICFGSGCSTVQIIVPATPTGGGLCIDNTYFGTFNAISVIRGSLSTAASVTPQITIW